MKDRRDSPSGPTTTTPLTAAAIAHLEACATGLWEHARDFDRWGLALDAEETRNQAIACRVEAIIARATTVSPLQSF
ncbi:hypothetical protein VQ042_09830 [Aurantimonas sp. A2-1-M11]|uniref:hypothetical protein n=1 Tax=Aurantimonas sp. A2-1-M11 TaxID=3113712 RepID=UPI002F945E90